MIRKFISFLLIAAIVFLIAGGSLLLYFLQQANYSSMQNKINSGLKSETVILSVKDFNKARKGKHEMKWQNRMYDISKVEFKNNTVVIYCMHDKKEDKILKAISGLMKHGNHKAVSFKFFVFLCDNFSPLTGIKYFAPCRNIFTESFFSELNFFLPAESPPPRG